MSTFFFSHDEPAALVYALNKATAAGYPDEAAKIRRQPGFTDWITKVAAAAISLTAALFKRDEPAALAYEANQMAACGYVDDAVLIQRQPSFGDWIQSTLSAAVSVMGSLSSALIRRDLPAALRYDTSSMTGSDCQPENAPEILNLSGLKSRKEAIHKGAAAIIAWDKQLRHQHTPSSAASTRPVQTFNAR